MKFYDAILRHLKIFGAQVHMNLLRIVQLHKLWKNVFHLDLDNKVQLFLFRILCTFLDQGFAIKIFPIFTKPFVESF